MSQDQPMSHPQPVKKRIPKPADFVPIEYFDDDHPMWPGVARCCAWNGNEGRQCNAPAVRQKQVCQTHGGMTPGGIASPHFKTGKYSKYIPEGMHEVYERGIQDSGLIELREELALVDGRISQLLQTLQSGGGNVAWRSLSYQWQLLDKAMTRGDAEAAARHRTELNRLIDEGGQAFKTWEEIYSALDLRRKLAEAERRRIMDAEQFVTAREAMALITAVMGVIKENVVNPAILRQIARGIDDLTSSRRIE